MKLIRLLTIALLCSSPALAVGLSIPGIHDVIYEQGKTYTFDYDIHNKYSKSSSVTVIIDTGGIDFKIPELSENINISAASTYKYTLSLTPPETLPSGIYQIYIKVVENSEGSGMSAVTGVGDTLFFIKPYEQGMPYGTLTLRKRYAPDADVDFMLNVQNLGKEPIGRFVVKSYLLEKGVEVKKVFESNPVILESLAKNTVPIKFSLAGLSKGSYILKTVLVGDVVEIPRYDEFNIGSPDVTLLSIPDVTAGKENEFEVVINNAWNSEITNATFRLFSDRELLVYESSGVTIVPGKNVMKVKTNIKNSKTGVFNSELLVFNKDFNSKTSFSLNVQGSNPLGMFFFNEPKEELTSQKESSFFSRLTPQGMFAIAILLIICVGGIAFYCGRRSKKPA